jgi:hydrogenase/urease accessory protein HupE
MNIRLFAALIAAIFFIGAIPLFFAQPSGTANAGLAAGFMVPFDDFWHIVALIATGMVAAWLGKEAFIVYPLSSMLMLVIGGLMQLTDYQFPALQGFTLGAILLFALSISTLRNKLHLIGIPVIAIWSYYSGDGYMYHIPMVTTPLYFLLGMVINSSLMLAIGISIGVTFSDAVEHYSEKFRMLPAISVFLSLF